MKMEKSVAGVWNRMVRDNIHLVKFDLGESYPPPLSLKDILGSHENEESLLHDIASLPLGYALHTGSLKLKEELCKFYPNAIPENIVLAHGAIAANDIVIRSLFEPGDNCVCVAPAYQQLLSSPKAHNYEYREILLKYESDFKFDFEEMRAKVDSKTKLIVIGNPNNPSGAACSQKELMMIVEIAKSVGAYVLCDEIYKNFEYDVKMPTMYGMYEKAIVTNSLSKAFGYPGLRVGWIVASKELAEEFTAIGNLSGLSVGCLDEKIAVLALQKHDQLIQKYLVNCSKNRELLDKWVDGNNHISYIKPEGGPVAIIKFDFNITSTDLCHRLLTEHGVNLLPGASFYIDDTFRIGFTCEPEELLNGFLEIDKLFVKLENERNLQK